jgi:hypothetical protein
MMELRALHLWERCGASEPDRSVGGAGNYRPEGKQFLDGSKIGTGTFRSGTFLQTRQFLARFS